MKKILLIACIITAIAFKTNANEISLYTIEKKTCLEPHKCSYDIRIKSKLSEDELLTISYEIFDEAPAVQNVFMTFYLPCMKIGHGAWASVIYNPTPKVIIMDYMLAANATCIE